MRNAVLAMVVLLSLGTVRCAHSSPKQRACEKRVNDCLNKCEEPAGKRELQPDGCAPDIRTDCERSCHQECEW